MKHFIRCIPVVFLAMLGTVHAGENLVADVMWNPNQIQFVDTVAGRLSLTVSGNSGKIYTQNDYFEGETPVVLAYDEAGPLPDGHYKYELSTVPEEEEDEMLVQNGSFKIIGGVITSPSHNVLPGDEPNYE